jgi:hypothetical protein
MQDLLVWIYTTPRDTASNDEQERARVSWRREELGPTGPGRLGSARVIDRLRRAADQGAVPLAHVPTGFWKQLDSANGGMRWVKRPAGVEQARIACHGVRPQSGK